MQYTFTDLFHEVKRYKKELILANLIALIATIISTPIPLLMPLLVDEVLLDKPGIIVHTIDDFLGSSNPAYIYVGTMLGITLLMRCFHFVFNYYQTKMFTVISKNITYKMRKEMLEHLGNVSLSGYEFFGSGKASSLMVVDVETVDQFLGTTISRLIISILTVIGIGIVLLFIHWPLAIFILLLNPFVVTLTTKIARRVSKLKKEQNKAFEIFQDALNETLELFIQVRASNQEKRFIKNIAKKADVIKDRSIEFGYKSDAATRFSFLVFLSGFEVFRASSILVVAYSDLTIGLMLAIFGYLWMMMGPIQEILGIQYAFHNAKAALGRINEIFALPREPNFEHTHNPFEVSATNEVQLKNVDFSYDGEKKILEDITIDVPKGKKVALIGASGSGKTTLAQIIVGFYPIEKGTLAFDGIGSDKIGLDTIRDNVFLVLQNPQLFNDTIRMNITLGADVDHDRIAKAIEIAQLRIFIDELPDGLETKIGKQGIKLSGGQRQRLSIARMIIQDPNIVILDESTSALDVHTEEVLFKALDDYLKSKTTIIIAHRLSTIRNADYIYVLDKGRILESGTREALLENESVFSSYFNKKLEEEK